MAARTKNPDKELELLDHLGELRSRLIRVILYLVIGAGMAWWFFDPLYKFLLAPAVQSLPKSSQGLLMTGFMQAFTLKMQVALVGGAVLVGPLITTELWMFVAPALTRQERKAIWFVAPLSVVLFASGVALCYYAMPRAFGWFVSLVPPNVDLRPEASATLVFAVQMYLAFGVMFEMPVVLMFLGKVGIVNSKMMIRLWREATVGIAAIAAIATPSNDAFTMMLMAVPMVVLYFFSIGLVKMVED